MKDATTGAAGSANTRRAETDRWFLSDCEGRLEIWREAVLRHVTRDERGEITGYQTPGSYRCTDLIAEWDLNTWDAGEDVDDDQRRAVAQAMVRDHNERAALHAELEDARDTIADPENGLIPRLAKVTAERDQLRMKADRYITRIRELVADRRRAKASAAGWERLCGVQKKHRLRAETERDRLTTQVAGVRKVIAWARARDNDLLNSRDLTPSDRRDRRKEWEGRAYEIRALADRLDEALADGREGVG